MADNGNGDNGHESGSKDRATVALVDAKIDGLKDLIRAEFSTVKEDVRALAAVVADVIKQGVHLDDLERRVTKIEADKEGTREYRRGQLPVVIFAALSATVAIVALAIQIY